MLFDREEGGLIEENKVAATGVQGHQASYVLAC